MTTTLSELRRRIGEGPIIDLDEALQNNHLEGYWYEAGRHGVDFDLAEKYYNLYQNGGVRQ